MTNGPFDRPDSTFNTLKDWTWIGCYGGYYLQSDLLHDHGFEHGFFTRLWQGRGPDQLAAYMSAGISIHRPHQVHSGIVLDAGEARQDPWPDADGLVSDRGGQSLWVCGADCTPVLLADPQTGHVASCHAGWRGVAAGILASAIDQLEQRRHVGRRVLGEARRAVVLRFHARGRRRGAPFNRCLDVADRGRYLRRARRRRREFQSRERRRDGRGHPRDARRVLGDARAGLRRDAEDAVAGQSDLNELAAAAQREVQRHRHADVRGHGGHRRLD